MDDQDQDKPLVSFQGQFEKPLDSYKSFFDHGAAKRLMEISEGTVMEVPVLDLLVSWRGLVNTHAMPYSMIAMLRSLWGGFHTRDTLDFARKLSIKHSEAVRENVNLSVTTQKQIERLFKKVGKTYATEMEKMLHPDFPEQELWDDLCSQDEFVVGITATQGSVFGGLYHHFENFLRQTIGILKNDPDYRIPSDVGKFTTDMQRCLGNNLDVECIKNDHMKFARLVRNALAHKGGKVSPELLEMNKVYEFPVIQDRIQIVPSYSAWLFDMLMKRVLKITGAALLKLQPPAE